MLCFSLRSLGVGFVALGAAVCHGQLTNIQVQYAVSASATLPDMPYTDGTSGTTTALNGAYAANATGTYTVPGSGEYHTATGSSSMNWGVDLVGLGGTIRGGAGALAEGYTELLDVWASAGASLFLEFDLGTAAKFDIDDSGTFGIDIGKWNGSSWDWFLAAVNFPITENVTPGRFAIRAQAGESISGSSFYSSGDFFTIKVEPVPEPATIAALGVGVGLLARRRRAASKAKAA